VIDIQHRTALDSTGQHWTAPDSTGQHRPDSTVQHRPDSTGQNRTAPDSTGHNQTQPDTTGHNRTQNRTLPDMSTHGTVQNGSDMPDTKLYKIGHSGHQIGQHTGHYWTPTPDIHRTFTGHSPDITGHRRTYRTSGHPGLRGFRPRFGAPRSSNSARSSLTFRRIRSLATGPRVALPAKVSGV
jgi:hypothetical protein